METEASKLTKDGEQKRPKGRFEKPNDVLTAWRAMREAAKVRVDNRAKINAFAGGETPYQEDEADAIGLETNINWNEFATVIRQGRQKVEAALIDRSRFFNVRLRILEGELDAAKKRQYEEVISNEINRILKRSQDYNCTLEQLACDAVVHGLGVSIWFDQHDWCPEFISLDDVQFPGRTFTHLRNLDYFGIYKRLTYSELKEFSEKGDGSGWNKKMLKAMMSWLLTQEPRGMSATTGTNVLEAGLSEADLRESKWSYSADIVQPVYFIDFYFKDTDSKWKRRILPDFEEQGMQGFPKGEDSNQFVYQSDSVGGTHEQIIHLLITDLLNTTPFRINLIQGLGYMLYAPMQVLNRIRCKLADAVFTNLLELFRVTAADDQERLSKIDLYNYGVVPEGLQWVPGNERYKPDFNLINAKIGQINQTVGEIAASFRSDPDDGTQREMTAREVMARVNQASAMVGAILNKAFRRMKIQYTEIARRFCIKGSPNDDVKEFRKACEENNVPEEYLAIEKWEVIPDRPIGDGIKTLELAQTEQLMSIRAALPPHGQQLATHLYVAANSTPDLANEMVPLERNEPSPSVTHASAAMGTILQGVPYVVPRSVNLVEFATVLVGFLFKKVQQIEQASGMVDAETLGNLQFAFKYVSEQVMAIQGDEAVKGQVKQLADVLGEISNILKAFQQRLEEAMQHGQMMDPEAQAKITGQLIKFESDAKINEAKASQKLRHQEEKFQRDQDRRDVATQLDMQRKGATTQADIELQDASMAAEIRRKNAESRAKENQSGKQESD